MVDNITNYGTYHMADNPELYDPQRTNAFQFVVTGIDNILRAGAVEGEENATITNAQNVLTFSVVRSSVPTFSQNPIEIKRGNSTIKFAGTPTFENGTLVINDFTGADGKSILMAWQNLSYNVKEERVGRASEYKKTCYLQEYTPDFTKLVRTWRMVGCWVSGITQDEFNSENSDKKTVQATISYDKAFMEMPD